MAFVLEGFVGSFLKIIFGFILNFFMELFTKISGRRSYKFEWISDFAFGKFSRI
jgi:hypothetical protein